MYLTNSNRLLMRYVLSLIVVIFLLSSCSNYKRKYPYSISDFKPEFRKHLENTVNLGIRGSDYSKDNVLYAEEFNKNHPAPVRSDRRTLCRTSFIFFVALPQCCAERLCLSESASNDVGGSAASQSPLTKSGGIAANFSSRLWKGEAFPHITAA